MHESVDCRVVGAVLAEVARCAPLGPGEKRDLQDICAGRMSHEHPGLPVMSCAGAGSRTRGPAGLPLNNHFRAAKLTALTTELTTPVARRSLRGETPDLAHS